MLRTSHAGDGSMDVLHVRLCEIGIAVPYCIQSEWLSRACEGHARWQVISLRITRRM